MVYYLGFFSEGSSLCAFGSDRSAQGMEEAPVRWENLDIEATAPLGSPREGDYPSTGIGPDRGFASRPYSILPWVFPRFWYPSFSISSDAPWAAGAWFVRADPAETFALSLGVQWIPSLNAANLSADLEITAFAPAIVLEAWDEFSPNGVFAPQRTAGAGLSAVWDVSLYDGRFFGAQVGSEALGFSSISSTEKPYKPFDAALASGIASVSYGRWAYDVNRPAAFKGARVELTGFAAYVLPPDDPEILGGVEAALRLRALPAALALDLYGAFSFAPSLTYGPDGRIFAGFLSGAAYPEYAAFAGGDSGRAYAYADASAAPLVVEVTGRLGPIYLQRFVLRMGGRSAVSDGVFLYSGYVRLTLAFAPLLGLCAELRPEAWAEADYAPRDGRWTLRYTLELPL